MVRRWLVEPRFRPVRVAFWVVLFFLGLDGGMRAMVARQFASGQFRLPNDSRVLLPEFLDFLAAQPQRKIYLVGDSTMQGQKLAADETLPARLAPLLPPDWLAANLGLTATKLPDFFYVTAKLKSRPGEVVVANVNYKNFGAWDLAVPLRFKDFYDASLDRIAGADAAARLDVPVQPPAMSGRMDRALGDLWFFYRNRDLVRATLFGQHPRKVVKSYYQVFVKTGVRGSIDRWRRRGAKSDWSQTRWDPWALNVLRDYYRVAPLTSANPVFAFVEPLVRLGREKGLVVALFANPMNREFFDKNRLVDWAIYVDNQQSLRAAVERAGGIYLDYTDVIPPSEFLDNDHLTAAGSRRLAARLAADLAAELNAAEASR